MTKQSQYIEQYDFDIFFPEKVKDLLGKTIDYTYKSKTISGTVTDYKFSDTCFIQEDGKYLAVKFQIDGETWTKSVPTDIKELPVSEDYQKSFVKFARKEIEKVTVK